MKKILTLLLCAVSSLGAWAYNVDFNTAIATGELDFKVAPGWKHLVSKGSYASQKVTYTYNATGGVDDSGCISVGDQSYFDYFEYADVALNDLLVSPAVSGTITIDVKKNSAKGNVKFFKVTIDGGNITKGEEISYDNSAVNSDNFTTVTLTNIEVGTFIGIRAENVTIDNFTATEASIVLTPALTITSVVPASTSQSIDCDENNQFEVKATVKVKNTGDKNLTPGDEGYEVSLALMKNEGGKYVVDKILATQPINVALAVGEETEAMEISAKIAEETLEPEEGAADKSRRYDVVEGIGKTSQLVRNYVPVPYRPILSVLDGGKEIDAETGCNFGLVTGNATKKFTICNDGAADMNITNISIEGDAFSITAEVPFTVAKHATKEIEVACKAETPGSVTGKLTIAGENMEAWSMNMKAEILDPTMWYVNFEDGKMPDNMLNLKGWAVENKLVSGDNKYYAVNNGTDEGMMLVSPLLSVAEGETLKFDAARNYGDVSSVNIYYSSDRKNWTKVRSLSANATEPADMLTEEYTGTKWGSNTKYNFTTFEIANIPAGNVYIAFEAVNARVDNILGYHVVEVAHDLYVTETETPAVANINNVYTVTAKLQNLTANTETEYTASLLFGDDVVATAEAVEIEGFTTKEFTFSFTPHTTGTFAAKVVFSNDNFSAESNKTEVVVNEEESTKTVKIGNNNAPDATRGNSAPLALYYKKSDSENIYLADQLGLAEGTKITHITFKGKSSSAKSVNATLKVLIENTEDAAPAGVLTNEEKLGGMTEVYNGSYTYDVKTDLCDVVSIDLATPFVYTGKNLRIVLSSESTSFCTVYFECDNDVKGQSAFRSNDRTLPSTTTESLLPTLYLTVTAEAPKLSGTVKNAEGAAIANAEVTLRSGDVIYSAKTDNDGAYSMNIVQSSLSFDVTVMAEGYLTFTSTKELTDGKDDTMDITLDVDPSTGITSVNGKEKNSYEMYDLTGRRLKIAPQRGIVIINGKKVVKK